MLEELGIDFHEFSEFLVLQILFKSDEDDDEDGDDDVQSKVKEREELYDMLTDDRMMDLFKIFDKDGSRILPFSEVATGLYQVTLQMDPAVRNTMGLLLMMDKDEQRTLNYEQFGRLIMAIAAAAESTFEEIYEDLMVSLTRADAADPNTLRELLVNEEMYKEVAKDAAKRSGKNEEAIDALSYGRLQKLFDLWDVDGDGDITLTELHGGLKKFQEASGIKADAKKEAMALLGFDEDGDLQLGRLEFAKAMIYYAKAYKVALHDLVDFMCVATLLGEKNTNFQEAYGKAIIGMDKAPVLKPANLTFAEEDFSEFSDDDFA